MGGDDMLDALDMTFWCAAEKVPYVGGLTPLSLCWSSRRWIWPTR